jgi:myotubularin-related protein 3/4
LLIKLIKKNGRLILFYSFSKKGFRTLIEVDWLLYGHKFDQRNGHAANFNDINERCPVFLQWFDCIYQIARQFQSAFQFKETYLLGHHSYSCLFGTFLCDWVNKHTDERTFSIWPYLNDKNKAIVNNLYDDHYDEVLYPKHELVHMQLWHKLFCESETTYLTIVDRLEMQNLNDSVDGGVYGSPPLYTTSQFQQSSE